MVIWRLDILSKITQCLDIDDVTLEEIVRQYLLLYMKIDDLGSLYSIFNDATGRVQEILNKFKKKLELFYSKLNEIKNDVRFNDELGRPHGSKKMEYNGCCALLTYNFNKWHQNNIKEPNESNILNKHWARRKWELNKDDGIGGVMKMLE